MAACNCILSSSLIPLLVPPLYSQPKRKIHVPISSCNLSTNQDHEEESRFKKVSLSLLKFSATLTVISASLPQPSYAAPKVSEKKRPAKKIESLTPEELHEWNHGLPMVSHRLAYTDMLDLRRENRLKHIIKKHSNVGLRQLPGVVLAVFEDNKVVRIVLPSVQRDPKFWAEWDELKIDVLCMNTYSPPLKSPEMPRSYLGFLSKVSKWIFARLKPKPKSKKALEFKRAREELERRKNEDLKRMKDEKEKMERMMKMQRKEMDKQKRREEKERNQEKMLRSERTSSIAMPNLWGRLADDSNFVLVLGLVFFYIFYHTVVLNYKKQKKDYDDRLKIERAEAEEKRKMRELQREMEVADDEEQGEEGEENHYMQRAKQFFKSGARRHTKGLPQHLERGTDVKFTDVAGLGKIRLELEEIVKFFSHGEMYRRRGIKIPGGILLCGPPGVGKTLLAKAVACEAGVNFFSISASQFVEIYVGLGASRVRALYQEARENAPSVVFIDELDAVGRKRGLIKGSQERDATLNQLLVCLDGFEGRGEVITIACTNRPEILDPALVRPGRFDRKIHIPKPGLIGRVEILKVHVRKKRVAPDVDYMAVAAMTDGMVGAELANIIEVAAITVMCEGRTEITTDDLLQAAQVEELGMLDKNDRSPEMWKQVAVREAAMAIVAVNFPDLRNIELVTISPRAGRDLGHVRVKMDNMKFTEGMLSRQSILDHITVQLAPRAADELWYGADQFSTIWADTADNARSAARSLVVGGLSEKHYGLNNFWTEEKMNDIDSEALWILDICYERAKTILEKNRQLMDAVVHGLVEKKSLNRQEFFDLVDLHGSLQPLPSAILDIRSAIIRTASTNKEEAGYQHNSEG